MKKFLILGFGRMGITHYAHINGALHGDCFFEIFDPSVHFKLASFFNIRKKVKFLRKMPKTTKYDAVIVTSPPHAHEVNLDSALELSDMFFVEKPLSLSRTLLDSAKEKGKKLYCGYVLRNNPCIEYLSRNFTKELGFKVDVNVLSNLGKDETSDWRFDLKRGGGCLNELGSHAINLALLFKRNNEVPEVIVNRLDVGEFDINLENSGDINITGDWNTDVRKTMYSLRIKNDNIDVMTDLQKVTGTISGQAFEWSPREEALDVGFYIRGVDFAAQNESWLSGDAATSLNLSDAQTTDFIISEALKNV